MNVFQPKKAKESFRQYDSDNIRDTVKRNYYLNHTQQTVEFVKRKRTEYGKLNHGKMSIWEVAEKLEKFVDDSDPDTSNSQLAHAMQTAEAARRDGQPRWFILAAFIHDLGKILGVFGEPQWAVVGDTFPVGCQFSDKIVYPEYFKDNPDMNVPEYQTKFGIYSGQEGLGKILISWGHDEYLYMVTKAYLPEEAQYIIRYHSFYPCHREGDYTYLMNEHDKEMFKWVKEFNKYDLYSKAEEVPDIEKLKPFYQELVAEFFPEKISW